MTVRVVRVFSFRCNFWYCLKLIKHFLSMKNLVHALNDVNFQIDEGEIFGIVGFSGVYTIKDKRADSEEMPSCGRLWRIAGRIVRVRST